MIENSGEGGELVLFEDIKRIVDNVPGLYFHLDLGHAFIWDGMKGVEKYLRYFKKKLSHPSALANPVIGRGCKCV